MKKVYVFALVILLVLSGCSKTKQMSSFIPTTTPNSETEEVITPTGGLTATPTPKTIYVGQTIPKYVKLTEYEDVLNVRSAPSTDTDNVVGFLVHTEKIDVIEITDGWASFVYNDAVCYVNADFLVDEKPDILEPPTPTPVPKNDHKSALNSTQPEI